MKLNILKKLSYRASRKYFDMGVISHFEMMFRDYLNKEIDWPKYTAKDITEIRERWDLTQEGLALLLGVSPTTVIRWEKGGEILATPVVISLFLLDSLGGRMFELMPRRGDTVQRVYSEWRWNKFTGKDRAHDGVVGFHQEVTAVPESFGKEEVVVLRNRLKKTKKEFAEIMGVSLSTVEKWEGGAVTPKGPALILLKNIWRNMHEKRPVDMCPIWF